MKNLLNLISEDYTENESKANVYIDKILEIFKDNLLIDKFVSVINVKDLDGYLNSFCMYRILESQGYVCSYEYNNNTLIIDFGKTIMKKLNGLSNIREIKNILNKIPDMEVVLNIEVSKDLKL